MNTSTAPLAVPFCDLTRLSCEVGPLVLADWTACAKSASFIEGPRVQALEAQLSTTLGAPHVVACANGTDALVLGLLALGIGHGDRVALPALTFWATYEAVVTVGATPILIDVDPDDLQLSLSELRAAHDAHRIDAAILVHLFGWASGQLKAIRAFCADSRIRLLEDGAQSFGVEVDGQPILAGADIATLSFYPAKVIGSCSDAGAVTCQTEEQAARLRSLRNHGRGAANYEHSSVGLNSRMGALSAAYLAHVVAMSERILDSRREAVAAYARLLDGRAGLKVWQTPSGVVGNGYLSVITSDRKTGTELATGLQIRGIGCARTYPVTIAEQWPARSAPTWGDLAVSRAFCQRVVNLPVFYNITASEVAASASALLEVAS